MIIDVWPLAAFTFWIGLSLGRRHRKCLSKADNDITDVATRYYFKGYGAAIKEFGIERGLDERRKLQKLQIVGGKDAEAAQ